MKRSTSMLGAAPLHQPPPADGRQGTLNGTAGAADFTTGACISSVIP